MKQIQWLALAALSLTTLSHAASFDCGRAKLSVEFKICNDAVLSKLDEELSTIYSTALQIPSQNESIRNRQKKWIRERNECSNTLCITNAYLNQLAVLKQYNSITRQEGSCFAQIRNNLNQFDVRFLNGNTYAQPVTSGLDFSEKAILVFNSDADFVESKLCNGNRILVWSPEPFRDFPVYLMAQIMDDKFKPLSDEFRVSEINEQQNEQSVTALLDGGFVVIWKSVEERESMKFSVAIKGRLFDQSGKPRGKSFIVTSAEGMHYGLSVSVLPNGGFAVMWSTSNTGNFFRLYKSDGLAKSDVVSIVDTKGKFDLIPHGYATESSVINVFMELTSFEKEVNTPFHLARSYDVNANVLTEVLTADRLQTLDGYQSVLESVIRKHVLRGNYEYQIGCNLGGKGITEANRLKRFSNVKAVKKYLTKYCQAFELTCKGQPALNHVIKYNKGELEECTSPEVGKN